MAETKVELTLQEKHDIVLGSLESEHVFCDIRTGAGDYCLICGVALRDTPGTDCRWPCVNRHTPVLEAIRAKVPLWMEEIKKELANA